LRDQECQKTQKPLFIILSVPEWLHEKMFFRYAKDVLRITVGKKDSTTSAQKNVRAHFSQGILKWGERNYFLTFIARLITQISGLVKKPSISSCTSFSRSGMGNGLHSHR